MVSRVFTKKCRSVLKARLHCTTYCWFPVMKQDPNWIHCPTTFKAIPPMFGWYFCQYRGMDWCLWDEGSVAHLISNLGMDIDSSLHTSAACQLGMISTLLEMLICIIFLLWFFSLYDYHVVYCFLAWDTPELVIVFYSWGSHCWWRNASRQIHFHLLILFYVCFVTYANNTASKT